MNTREIEKICFPFALCIICVTSMILTYKFSLRVGTDMFVHAASANNFLSGSLHSDYPVLYLTFGAFKTISGAADAWVMAYTQTFYTLLCSLAVYVISAYALPNSSPVTRSLIMLFMAFCGPIYLGGIHYYNNTGSFNTWHNPTNTSVKFLSLVIFFLFSYLYKSIISGKKYVAIGSKNFSGNKVLILISVLLLASPLFKPSFFQVFGPFVATVVVFDFIRGKISLKNSLKIALALLPALCLIFLQTFNIFMGGNPNSERGILIAPFRVWNASANLPIPVCIALTVAFPLFIWIFCNRGNNKSQTLSYAFIMYFVSILEFSLLSETADWEAGNFGWGKNLAIGILYLSSLFQFIRYRDYHASDNTRKTAIITFGAYFLLSLHFLWGVWYYWELMTNTTIFQCF